MLTTSVTRALVFSSRKKYKEVWEDAPKAYLVSVAPPSQQVAEALGPVFTNHLLAHTGPFTRGCDRELPRG